MKCPHCLVDYHDNLSWERIDKDVEGTWALLKDCCPSCKRLIIFLVGGEALTDQYGNFRGLKPHATKRLVRPLGISRTPLPREVPRDVAEDYLEACRVLPDSPKASAALSRRCLQLVLREHVKGKAGNLSDEIAEFIATRGIPSHIAEAVDAVRNIGNFAAHPQKSRQSGEILPVEPGEAEWNLDVLESLFDFLFVQPVLLKRKRDELNTKLAEAGKPPMK